MLQNTRYITKVNFYFNTTCWRRTCKVFALLVFQFFYGIAQPSLRNFTIDDGLPSSEVYDAIQAENGSMWFATDRGVSNYNGYEFVNYTTRDGLTSNVVYELFEDHKGRIWFLTSNNQMSYWESGEIKEYSYNDKLQEINIPKTYFNSFYIDRNETVYLGTLGSGLIEISKEGNLFKSTNDSRYGFFFEKCENTILSYSKSKNLATTCFDIWYEGELINKFEVSGTRTKAFLIDNDLLCYNEDKIVILFDLKTGRVVNKVEFDKRIVSFKYIDYKLYVGLEFEGLEVFKIENGELVKLYSLLEDFTCSNIARDNQEGWWITTIEEGVFYSPNLNVRSFTKQSGLHRNYIKYLKNQNNKLTIGYGDSYQILDGNNLSSTEYTTSTDSPQKRKVIFTLSNESTFNKSGCILYLNNVKIYNECTKFIYPHEISSGFQVKMINDAIYICARQHLCKYSNGVIKSFEFESSLSTINDIEHISGEDFWIGLKTGLFKRTANGLADYSKVSDLFSNLIVDITQTKKHGLVLATKEVGILLYKDDEITILDTSNGLVSNNIIRLYADEEGAIWVATNKGLHRIDPDDSSVVDFINISDGILSNEIKDICRIDNNLYVGTKKGLSVVDLDSFRKQSIPTEISITSILLNKETLQNESTIDIYPKHKYLEINYLGINYPSQNSIEYKYRIQGLSDTWFYTKDRQIKLFSFPDRGRATLEVYAKTGFNTEWNEKPAKVKLRFHPPFYKRWDFRFSIISILGLLIYVGFKINLFSYNKLIQQELYNRLLQKLNRNSYLIIKVNTESIRINYNDIIYIKSAKDYVEIYTPKKKYLYRTTMKSISEELSDSQFMRVHRSYIVKKDKIDSISKEQIAIGKIIIPIGHTYKSALKEFAIQFPRLNK